MEVIPFLKCFGTLEQQISTQINTMNRSDLIPPVKIKKHRIETSLSPDVHRKFKELVNRSGIAQSAYLRSLIEDEVLEHFPNFNPSDSYFSSPLIGNVIIGARIIPHNYSFIL